MLFYIVFSIFYLGLVFFSCALLKGTYLLKHLLYYFSPFLQSVLISLNRRPVSESTNQSSNLCHLQT